MPDSSFFETQTRASQVKAEIVAKYFWVWAKIVTKRATEIGYVDLFAGTGRYGDGAKSTPLLILERAISDEKFARILHVVLNDRDRDSVTALRQAVADLSGIATLKHEPIIKCHDVDESVIAWFQSKWRYPSLVFLDPWGYKGLSLRLIHAALSRPLTDVIFFFNYNRVNAAITNEFMRGNVAALLTSERAEALREDVEGLLPEEREQSVLEALKAEVTLKGRYHWQDFRFTSSDVDKTSHYVILATKHPAGLKPMKEIMGSVSTEKTEGVPSMSYAPKEARAHAQMDMFASSPIEKLAQELLSRFAGQTLAVEEIFRRHHEGTKYLPRNYREALLRLEKHGKIMCMPPASDRQMRHGEPTLAEWVKVAFRTNVRPSS